MQNIQYSKRKDSTHIRVILSATPDNIQWYLMQSYGIFYELTKITMGMAKYEMAWNPKCVCVLCIQIENDVNHKLDIVFIKGNKNK